MQTELLIANKKTGVVWDVTNCTTTASWSTERTDTPGRFQFTLLQSGGLDFQEGDTVRFSVDGELQFLGWVFTKSRDRWGVVDVTCYDRLRYLKANASYAFYAQSAGDIIKQIAGDFQLTTGEIADTGFPIPSYIQEDTSCLDIISGAVQKTLLNTGKIFVFFDDGIGLALKEAGSMISNIVLGDGSLVTDYTYKSDIDVQTYNSIKLSRPNEQTGRSDVFIQQDSETIAQWGLLQLYQIIDGDANDAQVQAQAAASLEYYNREMRTLRVSSLGVNGLRAGQMALVNIPAIGISQYCLLESVSHTWENEIHTMEFETMAL